MAGPVNIRQLNRHHVLAQFLRVGTATRSDLARATGLSQPTTGKIVDELLGEGIVQHVATARAPAGRMGRPGVDLTLNDASPCFLALQLGVVHTRLAGLTVAPPPRDRWDVAFPTPPAPKAWQAAVRAAARPLLTVATRAVLVSVPGVLDDATGRSVLSPNLAWLEGRNVLELVEELLGLPVYAGQEIRCLALGHCAVDRNADSFLLVDFGTGVGSAAVLNGQLLRGHLPTGGELGHTPVPGNKLRCGCGGTGCLETLVGRDALLAALGIKSRDWYPRWVRTVADLSPRTLPRPFAEALEAAAIGIAGALNVLGLDRVVLTGFLSELPEPLLAILRERIQSAAIAGRLGVVTTTAAPRRRLAGLARIGIDQVIAPVSQSWTQFTSAAVAE